MVPLNRENVAVEEMGELRGKVYLDSASYNADFEDIPLQIDIRI